MYCIILMIFISTPCKRLTGATIAKQWRVPAFFVSAKVRQCEIGSVLPLKLIQYKYYL